MGIKMHKLGERCDLFQEGGQVTDPAIDKRMDFHFNAILDVVSEWRKDKSQNQDTPLGGAESLSPNTTWLFEFKSVRLSQHLTDGTNCIYSFDYWLK